MSRLGSMGNWRCASRLPVTCGAGWGGAWGEGAGVAGGGGPSRRERMGARTPQRAVRARHNSQTTSHQPSPLHAHSTVRPPV